MLAHVRLALLAISCLAAFAETLSTSPVVKYPGDNVTLEVAATSQPNRAPVTLHFVVVFPALSMAMEDSELGESARSSGKSLQCHVLNPYSSGCVISGGEKPIADGQIAIFHLRILKTAKAGKTALRIERAVSTTMDSKVVSLNDTEAPVMIGDVR